MNEARDLILNATEFEPYRQELDELYSKIRLNVKDFVEHTRYLVSELAMDYLGLWLTQFRCLHSVHQEAPPLHSLTSPSLVARFTNTRQLSTIVLVALELYPFVLPSSPYAFFFVLCYRFDFVFAT